MNVKKASVKGSCPPVTAMLRQGSACAYSRTKDLYKIKTGARNTTHLQLLIKKQEAKLEKLYVDIIHSKKNNIKKKNRLSAMCPIHKNGSMAYPLQGLFCTSHSSKDIKKIVVEETNDKIRIKLGKNVLKSEEETLRICLSLSFSCSNKCSQSKKSSSTILTRTYCHTQAEKRKRQISSTPILIQREPDHLVVTKCPVLKQAKSKQSAKKEKGSQIVQAKYEHKELK